MYYYCTRMSITKRGQIFFPWISQDEKKIVVFIGFVQRHGEENLFVWEKKKENETELKFKENFVLEIMKICKIADQNYAKLWTPIKMQTKIMKVYKIADRNY